MYYAKIGDFSSVSFELKTKNQIYSAMVIYGLLTYNNGQVFIPNKELMLKYDVLLFRESLKNSLNIQDEFLR